MPDELNTNPNPMNDIKTSAAPSAPNAAKPKKAASKGKKTTKAKKPAATNKAGAKKAAAKKTAKKAAGPKLGRIVREDGLLKLVSAETGGAWATRANKPGGVDKLLKRAKHYGLTVTNEKTAAKLEAKS